MKKTILTIIFLACAMSTLVAQDKAIQIFKNGEIIQSYELGSIDYIEINDVITPPSDIDADMESGKIIIKWQAVEGATYNIYRSADNQSYYLLAEELTENQYVDNNPLPGTNYYKVKAIVDGIESDYSQSSAGVTLSDSGLESGIYLGITGFNQQIYSYPINKLTDESKDGFDSFIDGLNMKNGTLLYYSVDETISAMQSVQLPADLSTAAIVTFTDGLDQGSIMMNGSYQDNTEYLNAINNRIKNEKIGGKPITAYSIGIRGQDVADVTTFQNNLLKLASSSENATEVTSMAEVNAKFKDIAEQLSQSNYIQTISLKMPGVSNGTVVRFTFDNVNSATKSTLYIEGTFNLSTRLLEDVKYVGLSSTSGMIINGVVDGIFVSFTFENVHTDNNVLIDNQFIDEWIYIPSNDIWQVNSEFDKDENSDIVTERSSAVIVLVLDCSSSLADDFVKAQANAKDFINTLYGAVGDNENSDDDSNNVIYSTTPQDLTLAIWKNGTRYYLTKEEYDKANLSDVVIEGVAIVSGGESFILSLKNVQTDVISSISTANNLYGDIMPTKNQGEIISAKWNDINTAIADFGGTELKSGKYYYTTSTASGTSWNYHNCISGSGGSLYSTDSSPYVRGVKPTNYTDPIYWANVNDLKLSVIINDKREFLTKQEYDERKTEITSVEGVAIITGGESFAIQLNNAQTDAISSISTANNLYGDIMPTKNQGEIISAKWNDINTAIADFGGTELKSGKYYYTTSTASGTSWNYLNCISGIGGSLYSTDSSPYVRGVTNIEK